VITTRTLLGGFWHNLLCVLQSCSFSCYTGTYTTTTSQRPSHVHYRAYH